MINHIRYLDAKKTEETQKTLHCAKDLVGSKPSIIGRLGRAPHDYFLPN